MIDEQHDAETDPLKAPDLHQEPDIVLMALVSAANSDGLSFDITLDVSGVIVSGRLIPASEFFKQAAQMIKSSVREVDPPEGSKDAKTMLVQVYEHLAEEFENQMEQERAEDRRSGGERVGAPVRYIHLRDAMVHARGAAPLPRVLWRGRLSHVSGWSHGSFSYPG